MGPLSLSPFSVCVCVGWGAGDSRQILLQLEKRILRWKYTLNLLGCRVECCSVSESRQIIPILQGMVILPQLTCSAHMNWDRSSIYIIIYGEREREIWAWPGVVGSHEQWLPTTSICVQAQIIQYCNSLTPPHLSVVHYFLLFENFNLPSCSLKFGFATTAYRGGEKILASYKTLWI